MPKISIIIPVYNAANHLAETVESVLSQTITEWELILVDDGSTDDSVEMAESFVRRDPRIRLVQQANSGVVAARNRGIQEISPHSEYVILLDHDDLWEPDTLQILQEALESQPNCVAAHGIIRMIDEGDSPFHGQFGESWGQERRGVVEGREMVWPFDRPTTFSVFAFGNCIMTPGQVLIRRAALNAVGSFDPACRPADDWDMWLRLSRLGDFVFLNQPLLHYRLHGNNASNNRQMMERAEQVLRRKLLRAPENTDQQKKLARRGRQLSNLMVLRARLTWAREHLVKFEFAAAGKQLRHAVKIFLRAFMLR